MKPTDPILPPWSTGLALVITCRLGTAVAALGLVGPSIEPPCVSAGMVLGAVAAQAIKWGAEQDDRATAGRVDRVGWGRADEGYIDVRFMLLKGTYEERIFHTVMLRDQWFQILS